MPPFSAFDAGIPATVSPSQVPKPPLTAELDNEQPVFKNVLFSSRVRIKSTLHLRDYTQEEKAATWLSVTGYADIKADVRFAVDHADVLVHQQDAISYCHRGLECRTKEGSRRRVMNKAVARNAVLDEQDRQFDSFVFNSEAIAKVYMATSHMSQVSARTMGLFDEQDARCC
jgi:hypothetical protein